MSRTILTSLFKKMPLRKGLVEHGMKFVCLICFLLKSLVFPSYCLQWCLMDVKQLVINFWSKTFSEQLILSLIWIWEPPIGRKERSNTHHIALRADLLSSFNPCTFCMLDVAGNPSNTDSFFFLFLFWQMIQESRVLIETADTTHNKIVQCQKAGNPSVLSSSGWKMGNNVP